MSGQSEDTISQTVETVSAWFNTTNYANLAMIIGRTIIFLVICVILKRILMRFVTRVLDRVQLEEGIKKFLKSFIGLILWFVIVLVVIASLNIPLTPFIAVFSVLGLALSLAVQDSLANFAGGVNVLASKPFVVGDHVEIDSDGGVVEEVGIIYTTLLTFDNRRIMLPNSKVMSARVTNYSSEILRRVDINVGTSYDDDIPKVQNILLELGRRHDKALSDPEPQVKVTNYGDSAIEYVLRVWCRREDYWDIYFDLMEQVKPELDRAKISIPYPHMNVLVENQKK